MKKATKEAKLLQAVEEETQQIGENLWSQLSRRTPSIFEKRWWDDRILSWAMEDESVKVQMFRFVDVLPMLRNHQSVTRHLQEYFDEVRDRLPMAVRLGLNITKPNGVLGRALAYNARKNAERMASRFIAGASVEDVLQTLHQIRRRGFAFTLDLLGEAIMSEKEADKYQQAYLDLMAGLTPELNSLPENELIDSDETGPIPRVNMSVKLSALYSQFKPIDPAGTAEGVKKRLRPLLRQAIEQFAYLHVDMEHYAYKDLTLEIFKQVLMEKEFCDYPHVGIVIQAYLPEAEQDLKELLTWVKKRGTPITVRLVKGAYWDYETVIAEARHWPVPVYQQKWESDANFEKQSRFLMKNYQWLRPAIASHNLRSLANSISWANALEVPQSAYELQMLYGMGGEQARLFAEMGHRVRIYTPFGELIPGMAYLVRRLLENTSNDSFLRQSMVEHIEMEKLFRNPLEAGQEFNSHLETEVPVQEESELSEEEDSDMATRSLPEFINEPHTDFSRPEAREQMQDALQRVASELGREYPLVIGGRAVHTKATLTSRNPSQKTQVVGVVSSASVDDSVNAIAAARRAFKQWSREAPNYRAEYMELVANEMRSRRFELAAWMVYECGKPWEDADGDVAEAIDFCMYYSHQLRLMTDPLDTNIPGEENSYFIALGG